MALVSDTPPLRESLPTLTFLSVSPSSFTICSIEQMTEVARRPDHWKSENVNGERKTNTWKFFPHSNWHMSFFLGKSTGLTFFMKLKSVEIRSKTRSYSFKAPPISNSTDMYAGPSGECCHLMLYASLGKLLYSHTVYFE